MEFIQKEPDVNQAPDFSQWPYTAPELPGEQKAGSDPAAYKSGLSRGFKIAVGIISTVFVLIVVATMVFFLLGPSYWLPDPKPERPLTAEWAFGADSVVEGKEVDFTLTASSAHQGTEACAAGATDPQAAQALRDARCQARVGGALTSTDGLVKASIHLLRFPDEASARRAARGLRYTQMRFLQQGRPTDGMVDQDGRFMAVTSITAKPKHKQQARTALIELSAIFV